MGDPDTQLSTEGFLALANELNGRTLSQSDEIASFWKRFMEVTNGRVIVDFLDMTNWDYITSADFDESTRVLTLVWRRYDDRPADAVSRDVFPGKTYGMVMKVQAIRAFAAFFFIRGYVVKEKEVATLLKPGTDEYVIEKESLFRRTVYARKGEDWSLWQAHVAALYSVALLPKGIGASTWQSHILLYLYNLEGLENELSQQRDRLRTIPDDQASEVSDRANGMRRILEAVLKIECAYRRITPDREYPELKLGELNAALKHVRTEQQRTQFNQYVRVLNEYSHDSGFPVSRDRLIDVGSGIAEHIEGLRANVGRRLKRAV